MPCTSCGLTRPRANLTETPAGLRCPECLHQQAMAALAHPRIGEERR